MAYAFGVASMGGLSLWHWIIVLLVVLILFGRGRISEIMGDFGKGIKSFKEGINEESGDRRVPAPPPPAPVQIAPQPVGAVEPIVPPAAPQVVPVEAPAPVTTEPKTGA
jgi:sec-independent protein translocase protein TatA